MRSALLVALFAMVLDVHAQGYPAKAVRIVVPHGAGGPADVPPRGIAQSLAQTLGQPFLVENRDGADGIIGAQACAKAAPDGYTLCSTTSSVITLNPAIRSDLPYEPQRDFAPLAYLGSLSTALLVNPSSSANSVRDLISLARAKPDSIPWGAMAGTGTGSIAISWFRNSQRAGFFQIPYKSTVQAFQAAVAGDVQIVAYAVGPAASLVRAGKLKALAVVGARRSELLPEVPSMKELGYEFEFSTWFGMFAPSRTPAEIVERLNAEIAKVVSRPEFRSKFLVTQGIDADELTGAPASRFAEFVRADRENVAKLLASAGLRPDPTR